ncbi:MAG TPA: MFS transporter, partial [Steroidobacteraceae bacterium]|nr:MFS transporter [Steroidobacteraceae bacterium]
MNTATHAKHIGLTIAMCFGVAVLEGFDIQALGVTAPKLAPEFKLAPEQIGLLGSMSNIGLVIGAGFGGWLADRVGRKPVFIAAVLAFGLFTLGTSLAQGLNSLFAWRFLAGLGFGAALPNMMAVAAEISTPSQRSMIAASMFCGMPFGGGTAALMTQLLPANSDWRTIFIMGGVLPLLLAILMFAFMTETLQPGRHQEQRSGHIELALFGEGRALPSLLLWLTFLPTLLILYLILNWLPLLVKANGLDSHVAPQASLAFNFASVAGALFFGRVVDKLGVRWPLAFAYGGLIAALIALGAAHELTSVLVLSGTVGAFLMGANYSLYGVAASYYPAHFRGTGSGASVAFGRVGSIIGPLLAGFMLGGGATA